MIYIYIICLYCGTVDVFVIQTTIYRGIFVFATFDYQRLCVRGGGGGKSYGAYGAYGAWR